MASFRCRGDVLVLVILKQRFLGKGQLLVYWHRGVKEAEVGNLSFL